MNAFRYMTLKYVGRCYACRHKIDAGARAWQKIEAKAFSCPACGRRLHGLDGRAAANALRPRADPLPVAQPQAKKRAANVPLYRQLFLI